MVELHGGDEFARLSLDGAGEFGAQARIEREQLAEEHPGDQIDGRLDLGEALRGCRRFCWSVRGASAGTAVRFSCMRVVDLEDDKWRATDMASFSPARTVWGKNAAQRLTNG